MKKEYLIPQIKIFFSAKEELCNPLNILSNWHMVPETERPEGEAEEDVF